MIQVRQYFKKSWQSFVLQVCTTEHYLLRSRKLEIPGAGFNPFEYLYARRPCTPKQQQLA